MSENKKPASHIINEKRKPKGIILSQVIAYSVAIIFIGLSIFFYTYFQREHRPDTIVVDKVEYSVKNGELSLVGLVSTMTLDNLVVLPEINDMPVVYITSLNNCQGVKKISIASSVRSISNNAFERTDSLSHIDVDSGNSMYSSNGGVLYNKDFSVLIKFPVRLNEDSSAIPLPFVIPDTVKRIAERAFFGAVNLMEVEFPEGLNEIGNSAFESCTSLTAANLRDNVTKIGSRAFSRCSSMLFIKLSSGLTELGEACFFECSLITSFSIGESNLLFKTLDNALYNGDTSLLIAYPGGAGNTLFSVSENTREIAPYAFSSNSYLKKIVLPVGLSKIGLNAFEGCVALKMVVLNSTSVPEINAINAFSYEINYYVIKEMHSQYLITPQWKNAFVISAEFSGDYAYSESTRGATIVGYSGDDNVVLPDEIDSLPVVGFIPRAFNGNRLESIVFNDNITEIDDKAFKKFGNLTRIEFSPYIESIGEEAFMDCTRLSEIVFNTLTSETSTQYFLLQQIGSFAFSNCLSLKSIALPAHNDLTTGGSPVTLSLGEGVFNKCSFLENIVLLCKTVYEGKNSGGVIANGTSHVLVVAEGLLEYYRLQAQKWSINQSEFDKRIISYEDWMTKHETLEA